ncbi:tRNA (adenosine(37)-N6)-threonylcarbamoyltransferase complex dimerization subunit type 1 TsaB [Paenibacillus sp. OAS669]|uniref:tRNA (adenosine(37)-N6)-threonylcarbamoyltransferase complex dimerization subunit type 1 TsaB n=1 Tax=Paenibacillus sp. OAS669 TaxID=2663821 RepID=UPI00178B1E4F|nr:tRNA (adenosine(37)-N6)-threonylcarbamoyltransferase complex dimerization subunit type 1 TsaB [Paenibacillus sp. OAS669]MBE1447377.1 tRNA threonylcarbamoyladenosine biosynthesis protein TsaB [Paenibacillus sp. OAS669]
MTNTMNALQGTLLAVDTSTSSMSLALVRGNELLGEINSKAERNHSIHLLPQIQQLLTSAGLSAKELDAFGVGVGPGSYTGVRIGVTAAKTFAWTHGMALLAVSSLETMALGAAEAYLTGGIAGADGNEPILSALETVRNQRKTVWVVPMIEARRGQAFTGLYQASGQGWSCLESDSIRLMSAWTEQLLERALSSQEIKPDCIVFAGETKLHEETLQRFFAGWQGESAELPHEIRARHLAELARARWAEGRTEEPHGLVPNYTQLPEAEVKLMAQKS